MLARLESALPRGPEWVYEPKLDGFRGLLWRSDTGAVRLLSRNLKDLSVSFPEVVRAAETLPLDTVIDGEIVIADAHGNSDFGALQERLSTGRRGASKAACDRPAVLLTFDVLRDSGLEVTDRPLRERRAHLEGLLEVEPACLQLIAQTTDVDGAEDWLRLLPGIEGVVAKRQDGRYLPGQRDWIKVKRRRTADCVVIGVAGDMARPWLVLGLRHSDNQVHHFGLARPSHAMLTAEFASLLAEAGPEESPIRSRWQHAAVPTWRRVRPIAVCEVAYTVLDGNRWARHAASFVRWRPDRSPDDCWLDQLARG
jgi:ATP-dependent DNA ligase